MQTKTGTLNNGQLPCRKCARSEYRKHERKTMLYCNFRRQFIDVDRLAGNCAGIERYKLT